MTDSDDRASASARAELIHTICECNQAQYKKSVDQQIQNFIIFGVDALIIWLSKYLLLLSIIGTRMVLNNQDFNCGVQPTISTSTL